ncbi:MAG: sialidase family protein [Gemmatimonadales bacterium]|jgi:hypothetical protein
MLIRSLRLAVALMLWAGCAAEPPSLAVGEIEFYGAPDSGEPNLYGAGDGRAILTWFEPVGGEDYALRVAVRQAGLWSQPNTIVEGDRFFVNWADFPSLVVLSAGSWLVHWPERVAETTYAYHVRLAISRDGGADWTPAGTPHRDASPTEHGFVSMVPLETGGAALVWLDGRQMAQASSAEAGHLAVGDMSLRATTFGADGAFGPDVLLDGRTCECCQTSLAATESGLIAAYRDRSESEVRNIAVVRRIGSAWTEPGHVADDAWTYPGCPVNGPQLATRGDTVVVAWFTAPEEQARVKAAFSFDGGATFGAPLRVDDGEPLGRVDVEYLESGAAVASWLERVGGGAGAEIRVRLLWPNGPLGASQVVAETSGARGSGFPRMARVNDAILVAWTEIGEGGGVRVAQLELVR